jgi:hypothetical protein
MMQRLGLGLVVRVRVRVRVTVRVRIRSQIFTRKRIIRPMERLDEVEVAAGFKSLNYLNSRWNQGVASLEIGFE